MDINETANADMSLVKHETPVRDTAAPAKSRKRYYNVYITEFLPTSTRAGQRIYYLTFVEKVQRHHNKTRVSDLDQEGWRYRFPGCKVSRNDNGDLKFANEKTAEMHKELIPSARAQPEGTTTKVYNRLRIAWLDSVSEGDLPEIRKTFRSIHLRTPRRMKEAYSFPGRAVVSFLQDYKHGDSPWEDRFGESDLICVTLSRNNPGFREMEEELGGIPVKTGIKVVEKCDTEFPTLPHRKKKEGL